MGVNPQGVLGSAHALCIALIRMGWRSNWPIPCGRGHHAFQTTFCLDPFCFFPLGWLLHSILESR